MTASQPDLIQALLTERNLPDSELRTLLETDEFDSALFCAADRVRRAVYGDEVYIRGLIEFTNHCKNKICTGDEAAQCRGCLERRVRAAGYRIVTSIGDPIPEQERSGSAALPEREAL